MTNKDELYCNEYKEKILKHFGFLINEHGYSITFLNRTGRYQSDCIYGMECQEKPKFQFGGELGPYVAVAVSTVKYRLQENDHNISWFYINRIDDYLSGRELNLRAEIPDWDEELGLLAETTNRLLPSIFEIFISEESVNTWRIGYDEWIDRGFEEYLRRIKSK